MHIAHLLLRLTAREVRWAISISALFDLSYWADDTLGGIVAGRGGASSLHNSHPVSIFITLIHSAPSLTICQPSVLHICICFAFWIDLIFILTVLRHADCYKWTRCLFQIGLLIILPITLSPILEVVLVSKPGPGWMIYTCFAVSLAHYARMEQLLRQPVVFSVLLDRFRI